MMFCSYWHVYCNFLTDPESASFLYSQVQLWIFSKKALDGYEWLSMKPLVFSVLIINTHIHTQESARVLFGQAGAERPRGPEWLWEPEPGQQQPDRTKLGQVFTWEKHLTWNINARIVDVVLVLNKNLDSTKFPIVHYTLHDIYGQFNTLTCINKLKISFTLPK